MITRAAIVGPARSGSTWLVSLLDSHPEIRFQGELFNLERAPRSAVSDPTGYLAERLAGNGGHRVVGCKILYHQARIEYLNDFLAELACGRTAAVDWLTVFPSRPVTPDRAPALAGAWEAIRDQGRSRIIHLRRRNLLRQHLSHAMLMAASRAAWSGGRPLSPPRVALATERMMRSFADTMRMAAEIDRFFARNPTLEVFYEDLSKDPTGQCDRILGFLEVSLVPLHSARRPGERRSLRAAIENYAEVADALARAGYARFLDDG